MAIQCDFCHHEPGLLLVSNQETGDVQSCGAGCMPTFLAEMSKVWDAWPDLDKLADLDFVREKAGEFGYQLVPTKATSAPAGEGGDASTPEASPDGKPKRGRRATKATAAKTATAGVEGVLDRVQERREAMPPTNWDEVPYDLLSAEEKAARDAAGAQPEAASAAG